MQNEILQKLRYHNERVKTFSELYNRCRSQRQKIIVARLMDYHITRQEKMLRDNSQVTTINMAGLFQ